MRNTNAFDEDIKKCLNQISDEINVSDDTFINIKRQINQKQNGGNYMKKTNILKAVACIGLVFATTVTCLAVGSRAKAIVSHSSNDDIFKELPSKEEVYNKINIRPQYVEEFSNGLKFIEGNMANVGALDDNDEKISSKKEIVLRYNKPGNENRADSIPLFISTYDDVIDNNDYEGEKIVINGVDVYYSFSKYKSVPPEYKVTKEEEEAVEKGELQIGYGASKIEENDMQHLHWVKDNIVYSLLDMKSESRDYKIEKDEFIKMAEEIINS